MNDYVRAVAAACVRSANRMLHLTATLTSLHHQRRRWRSALHRSADAGGYAASDGDRGSRGDHDCDRCGYCRRGAATLTAPEWPETTIQAARVQGAHRVVRPSGSGSPQDWQRSSGGGGAMVRLTRNGTNRVPCACGRIASTRHATSGPTTRGQRAHPACVRARAAPTLPAQLRPRTIRRSPSARTSRPLASASSSSLTPSTPAPRHRPRSR